MSKEDFINFILDELNLIEKQNKIIKEMAKMINIHDIDEDICSQFGKNKHCLDYTDEELCISCIIEYFTKQVEGDK